MGISRSQLEPYLIELLSSPEMKREAEQTEREYHERLEEYAWRLLAWDGEIDADLSPESTRFRHL